MPLDKRIPRLEVIGREIGLPPGRIPRKSRDPAYARVLLRYLEEIRELESRPALKRLLYIGNRRSRDQATLQHFREADKLGLMSFLCEEDAERETQAIQRNGDMLANRWEGLFDWARAIQRARFELNEETAAIVDMDKTLIAARGRNSGPLDRSRVEGVELTVRDLLGDLFQEQRFEAIYGELNQPRYYFITEDNQDYVTYIALMVSASVYPMSALLEDIAIGELATFAEFLELTGRRLADYPLKTLWQVQQEVSTYFQRGDPTVFKSFRRKQFESTVARIDYLPSDASEGDLLQQEIVMTREVSDLLQFLKERQVTLLLISDRPDESLIPSAELAAKGFRPVHQMPMKVVGVPLYDRLARLS